jgi:hypothetical protein
MGQIAALDPIGYNKTTRKGGDRFALFNGQGWFVNFMKCKSKRNPMVRIVDRAWGNCYYLA